MAEADRRLKRMQKRIREEQRRLLKGDHEDDLDLDQGVEETSSSEVSDDNPGERRSVNRPSSRRGAGMRFRDVSSSEESLAGHRARLSENDSDSNLDDEFEFDSADSNF